MELLQSLQIVFVARSVSNTPHAQVVHVRHHAPRVLKGQLLLVKEAVLESALPIIVAELGQVEQVPDAGLENA